MKNETIRELFLKVMKSSCGSKFSPNLGESPETYYEFNEDELLEAYDKFMDEFVAVIKRA